MNNKKYMKIMLILENGIVFKKDWTLYFLEKYYIAEFWVLYWWSFIENIWKALHNADSKNTMKILKNWEYEIDLENVLTLFRKEYDLDKNIWKQL